MKAPVERARAAAAGLGVALIVVGVVLPPIHVNRGYSTLWAIISSTASLPAVAIYTAIMAVLYVTGRCRSETLRNLTVSIVLAGLVGGILKGLVGRERPPGYSGNVVAKLVTIDVFSFPSGHAIAVGVFLYYSIGGSLFPLALVWSALVSLSRLLLGAHYVGDVLAGLGIGLVTSYLVEVFFGRWRHS
ncbi:MAG: phosphatase PAP2 family protein [Desulfurococcales archaeon]|nr:phosphatase PAP2 family protein [Desulfurococcales archaeon]